MLKIELVQPQYTDGNSTASPVEVVKFLHDHGFEIFKDHWLENHLYFGKEGGKVLDIDKIFGNTKLNVPLDISFLEDCAKKILNDEVYLINQLIFNVCFYTIFNRIHHRLIQKNSILISFKSHTLI